MDYLEPPSNNFIRDDKDIKIKDLKKEIPLIGIPWDWSTGGKPGARFAPQSIRNELFSMRTDSYNLKQMEIGFNDLGNVKVVPGDMSKTSERIIDVAEKLYKEYENKYPLIFLGGDHSITKNTLLPLTKFYEKIGLIIFDSHYDLRNVSEGLTSGSWLYELLNSHSKYFKVIQIGISDYSNASYMRKIAEKYEIKSFYRDILFESYDKLFYEIEKIKESTDGIYISIDMDHIDQSFAPGVNSPTPLGMYPNETIKILNKIINNSKILGIDVTEVSPPYDINNNTSRLAAKFILYSINKYLSGKNG